MRIRIWIEESLPASHAGKAFLLGSLPAFLLKLYCNCHCKEQSDEAISGAIP